MNDPLTPITYLVRSQNLRRNSKIPNNVLTASKSPFRQSLHFENPFRIKGARRGNAKKSIFGHMTSSPKYDKILSSKFIFNYYLNVYANPKH